MRYALIRGGKIATVVEQDTLPTIPGQWVLCGNAGPGFDFDGVNFTPPQSQLSVAEVLARLTVDEEAAIDATFADTPSSGRSARVDQARGRVLLRRINAKGVVSLDDADLVAWLQGAQNAGLLTAGRVEAILT